MNFKPELFISIGDRSFYFTLRQTDLWYNSQGFPYETSYHVCNLSNNIDDAIVKAKKYSEKLGLPLCGVSENMHVMLNKLRHASAEEIAAKNKQIEEEKKKREKERFEEMLYKIDNGIMPVGKYRDSSFKDIAVDYLNWIISKDSEWESGCIMHFISEKIKKDFSNLILPKPTNQNYIGVVGDRVNIKATVVRDYSYINEFGVNHFVTLISDTGECIVSRGKWTDTIGNHVSIRGTIKELGNYNGQNQTLINRVKSV